MSEATPPCEKKEVQTSEEFPGPEPLGYPKLTQLVDTTGKVYGVVFQGAPHADDWAGYLPNAEELNQQWIEHWREARGR